MKNLDVINVYKKPAANLLSCFFRQKVGRKLFLLYYQVTYKKTTKENKKLTKEPDHDCQKEESQILIRTFLIDCIQVAIALAFASALSHHIDFLNVAVAFGLWVVAQLIAAAYFILTAKD